MTKKDERHEVRVSVRLEDEMFRHFESEARRRGIGLAGLLETVIEGLLREMDQEEKEGVDHPITPS